MTPVFVTEKPILYADIYRDLQDVDAAKHLGREPSLLMTNGDGSAKVRPDEGGTKALAPLLKHSQALAHDIV